MKRRMAFFTVHAAIAACSIVLAVSVAHGAIVYDLNADWSDTNNPNGVWSYNEGVNPLPHVSCWLCAGSSGTFPPHFAAGSQPGWAPSGSGHCCSGNNLNPFWFKYTGAFLQGPVDIQIGDVVVLTTDLANGVGSGEANLTWTSPISGTATISGGVWYASNFLPDRGDQWTLFVNGQPLTSGVVSGTDQYDRANPFVFSSGTGGSSVLQNIPVAPGDVIKLELVRFNHPFGSFVGVNMTVTVGVPFADFTLTKAQVQFPPLSGLKDSFELSGQFTLSADSNGINLVSDEVVVKLGTASVSIPAGAFKATGSLFEFQGVLSGAEVKAQIRELKTGTFEFKVWGKRLDFSGTSNPTSIELRIGDDFGKATVRLEGVLVFTGGGG